LNQLRAIDIVLLHTMQLFLSSITLLCAIQNVCITWFKLIVQNTQH